MDDTVSPFLRVQTNSQDPDSADDPVARLLPGSSVPYPADEKPGFNRTWLATSSSIRPNRDPIHIEWGIHWYTPVSIVLLLLAGTTTAITHHLFYTWLHGSSVGNQVEQRWSLWIGSGLGFLTKVMLTAALGISRTQWVWLTLRSKWFTLDGIDALFGIISDPALFLKWRMIKKAKVATIMAIGMWMFPLAAILTPGTISVHTVPITTNVSCSVPSLSFAFDPLATAKIPPWSELPRNVTVFTFWTEHNGFVPQVLRSLTLPMYTSAITHLPSLPRVNSSSLMTVGKRCGTNCTYMVEFLGPAIICGELTEWSNTEWNNSVAYMDGSYYRGSRNNVGFRSFILGINDPDNTEYPSVIIECKPATANYTVQHVIEERRFLEPKITKYEKSLLSNDFSGWEYHISHLPIFVILSAVRDTLLGRIEFGAEPHARSLLSILSKDIYANPSIFGDTIEQMAQMITVSMIAFGGWMEGDGNVLTVTAIQNTTCTATENITVYVYSAGTLLVVYGLAVASALATSVAGFIALRQNGMASNRSVSTFIRTSRNRTLDEYIIGADCLGGDVMSSKLGKLKLRFGALKAKKAETAPFALGVKGEIGPIKRD